MLLSVYINQGVDVTRKLFNVVPFIFEKKLWQGFIQQKLALLVVFVAAIFIPTSLFTYIRDNISHGSFFQTTNEANIAIANTASFSSLFEGGNKFLVIILIQLLVVHISNKTIEHLSGTKIDLSAREMMQSQIRVIIVSVRNWVIELVIGVGIAIIIGIFGPDWLETVLKYGLSCYFAGYLFIDNYNNTFGISIKESQSIVKKHLGAACIIGLVTNILLLLPFIGAIAVAFVCTIGATWYMHTSENKIDASKAFNG